MPRGPVTFLNHGGGPVPVYHKLYPHLLRGTSLEAFAEGSKSLNDFFDDVYPKYLNGKAPEAIVVISAHWVTTRGYAVNTRKGKHELLYDYSGFPEQELSYSPMGHPQLAEEIATLLDKAQVGPIQREPNRGLDHGVFVPLLLADPKQVPVVELSINSNWSPDEHIKVGQALSPLRSKYPDVLWVASGSSYHNFGGMFQPNDQVRKDSHEFHDWLDETLNTGDLQRLKGWESAPAARANQPQEDHLVPLFVAAGLVQGQQPDHTIRNDLAHGLMCMSTYWWN